MVNPEKLELSMIQLIMDEYKRRGMTHQAFARKIYDNDDSAGTRWRRVRNGDSKGRTLLTVQLAVAAANALGMDFSSLSFLANEKCKAQ